MRSADCASAGRKGGSLMASYNEAAKEPFLLLRLAPRTWLLARARSSSSQLTKPELREVRGGCCCAYSQLQPAARLSGAFNQGDLNQ